MSNQIKIAIDIDGVLRNFHMGFHKVLVSLGRYPAYKEPPAITEWVLRNFYNISAEEFYYIVFNSHHTGVIFRDAPMYNGARDFINSLCDEYQVGVITSQTHRSAYPTLEWLAHHDITRPSIHILRFDLGEKDKTQFGYDILLDDKPSNVQQFLDAGLGGVLYDQPWNQEADMFRVDTYSEFQNFIDDLGPNPSYPGI